MVSARRFGAPARNDGGRDGVSEEVGAGSLDSVEVGRGEEHVEQALEGLAQVEEDKEGPVEEPCPCLELGEGRGLRVDDIPKILDFCQGRLPLSQQDIRGEFTPVGREIEVVRGGKDEEVVKEVGGIAICAERILVLSKVVQRVDLVQ
jgi:hypothetical protein